MSIICYTSEGEFTLKTKLFILKHLSSWLYKNRGNGMLYLCWEFDRLVNEGKCFKNKNMFFNSELSMHIMKQTFPELYKEIKRMIKKTKGQRLTIYYNRTYEHIGKTKLLERVRKKIIL